MDLGPLLNAHAYLVVERPPVLWSADVDDVALVKVLGEMIVAALLRGTELGDVILRASNVTVSAAPGHDVEGPRPPAPGDYVALSILGVGNWNPEIHWRPGQAETPVLVTPGLDTAARSAEIPYAYTRSNDYGGSVTVFLPRQT